MLESIGFIGAGRIAHIMLGGWRHASTQLPPVYVFDASAEALDALQAAFPQVHAASLAEVAGQALVFAALHPPVMGETLAQVALHLRPDALVVSLAPKLRLPALQERLGGFARVARMNPNAPAIIGAGFNPVAFSEGLPAQAREALLTLLAPLGVAPVVADELIETCAVISAMGPTYFWFQFEEVRRLAEHFGMDAPLARAALASMLHGAVDTLFASDLAPSRVMDLVPVRPLAEDEAAICAILQRRLGAIHARLTS
ncbi:MAG: oxidoreductase coenzyme F420-dependent [Proteobacteria bacterium]|nr:oxidoreductase coenzyme F420-dependent [Pseudomonadota bacterium]